MIRLSDLEAVLSYIDSSMHFTLNHSLDDILNLPEEKLYRYPFRGEDGFSRQAALETLPIYRRVHRLVAELKELSKGQVFCSIPVELRK